MLLQLLAARDVDVRKFVCGVGAKGFAERGHRRIPFAGTVFGEAVFEVVNHVHQVGEGDLGVEIEHLENRHRFGLAFDHHQIDLAYVENLAFLKAQDVAMQTAEDCVVIGADTIVVLGSQILNKPAYRQDAVRMLQELSGRTHEVYTALALVRGEKSLVRHRSTKVTFRKLDEGEILCYVESGSPMDKAGAYGIQDDYGAVFVERIEGCYYNIVGLPLEMLYSMLKEFSHESPIARRD